MRRITTFTSIFGLLLSISSAALAQNETRSLRQKVRQINETAQNLRQDNASFLAGEVDKSVPMATSRRLLNRIRDYREALQQFNSCSGASVGGRVNSI